MSLLRALTDWTKRMTLEEGKKKAEKKAVETGTPIVEFEDASKEKRRRPREFKERHPQLLMQETSNWPQGNQKLTDEEQVDLCKLIGNFYSPRDIELWAETKGKRINATALIGHYRKSEKWGPLIEKFRAEYRASVSEIPVANKSKRLFELNGIYDRIRVLEDFTDDPLLKLSCLNMEIKVVGQAQQETEGKYSGGEQTNVYFTQFNNMSREEFDKWRLNLAEKIKRYEIKGDTKTDGIQSQERNGTEAELVNE